MNTARQYSPYPGEPQPQLLRRNRRKHRGWRIFAWTILGIVLFTIAALLAIGASVNNDGVHRAILRFAEREASSQLGVAVRMQNFALHWSTLSLDLYGITAAGAAPHPNPPLLQVQHAEVAVRIVSVLGGKWYLSSLRIDRPIVWIYVDRNGVSNLPAFKSSGTSTSNNTLFDLGIRHAVLDGGELYLNSRPEALAADLHNLDLHAAYSQTQTMYSGRIAYEDGRVKYGAYRPIPHNLDVTFALTPNTLQLNKATLSSGDSRVELAATVSNYRQNPAVQAQYRVSLDGGQMAQLLNYPSIPAGFISASGQANYQDLPNRPAMQTLTVNGDLSSQKLTVKTGAVSAEVSDLAAHYTLAHGSAMLRGFHANLLGGDVTAQGTMTNLNGKSRSSFNASLHHISLAQLKQEMGKSAATPAVALAGTLNANASASWGNTIDDLVARADAGIHAGVSEKSRLATNARTLPIDSELHATYTKAGNRLELANSYLHTAQTDLTLSGTVSRNSSLTVRLQANDLRELAAAVNSLRPPAPNQQPLELAGTASFQGSIAGSIAAPRIAGALTATNLKVNGSNWKLVRAGVDASPDHAALQNAEILPAPRGRIALNARVALNDWAFTKQSPIQAQVNATQIDIAELAKFIGNAPPVAGTLNTSVNLHGSAMNPEGSGSLTLINGSAYQQPIQSVTVNFSGNGQQARAHLAVQLPGGSVQGNVTVEPRQRTFTAQMTSPGIHLDQLTALKARDIKANGVLALHAEGQGSFDDPQLNATVQIPALSVADQTINAVNLQMNLANHIANASLSSSALNTSIQAKATIHVTGDYMTDASLDTSVLNLQPLVALYAPDEADDISGQTQVHATIHGPLQNMAQMEAHVTIPVFKVAYQNTVQLAAAAPIQVNYQNGVLDVPQGAIRGTDTDLQFQARVPVNGSQPMSLKVGGAINLRIAQLFDPGLRSSGQLKLNIDSRGPVTNGNIGGEIEIVDASFAQGDVPVGLQHGNGVLKLTTDRVNIASFEGTVGGGKVELSGGVAYRPQLVFDLGLTANGVRMLYPQGLRENINAEIRLNGSATNAVLGGAVDVANLAFTPAFDLSSFAGSFSGGVAGPPAQGMAQDVKLNLAVHSASNIDLVSRELSVNGAANLLVRGTAAQPVILGRVNLNSGDIILNGNRFVLSGGTIQFVNPAQTEPVLNLAMTTTIQEYNINLRFRGPVEQIHPDYSSDPALPTADIIHLLAFGSTTEAAASNATPANTQAESLVASQVSSQVTSRISRVAGISQLSVSPVLQGGTQQGPPGADITIRQRVTGNLFVTFSTNVATTQYQVIQGQYQISPRVSFSATRDETGGFGFDTLIKKTW